MNSTTHTVGRICIVMEMQFSSATLILVNNQLDALFFDVFIYFTSLHVSSNTAHHQKDRIVLVHHLVYITLCRWLPGMPAGSSFLPAYQAVTYKEWYIPDDVLIQFDPSDDEHCVARNMYRSEINKKIHRKKCVKLVFDKENVGCFWIARKLCYCPVLQSFCHLPIFPPLSLFFIEDGAV